MCRSGSPSYFLYSPKRPAFRNLRCRRKVILPARPSVAIRICLSKILTSSSASSYLSGGIPSGYSRRRKSPLLANADPYAAFFSIHQRADLSLLRSFILPSPAMSVRPFVGNLLGRRFERPVRGEGERRRRPANRVTEPHIPGELVHLHHVSPGRRDRCACRMQARSSKLLRPRRRRSSRAASATFRSRPSPSTMMLPTSYAPTSIGTWFVVVGRGARGRRKESLLPSGIRRSHRGKCFAPSPASPQRRRSARSHRSRTTAEERPQHLHVLFLLLLKSFQIGRPARPPAQLSCAIN
jgi:hypothetical protein